MWTVLKTYLTSQFRSYGVVLILSLLLLSTSCSSWTEPDRSYLTGIPCAVPCWQGLTPGVSSERDAVAVLQNSDQFVPSTFEMRERSEYGVWGNVQVYKADHIHGRWRANVVVKDSIVISIGPPVPSGDLVMAEILDAYGPPQYIGRILVNETFFDGVLETCLKFHTIYPELGVSVRYWGCGESGGAYELVTSPTGEELTRVHGGITVDNIVLFPSNSKLEDMIFDLNPRGFREWPGLGYVPLE